MKKIQTILFLLVVSSSFAQTKNLSVVYDEHLDHPFFSTIDSIYNPLTLVFKDDKGRTHYDGVPDSNKYAVQSNCIINNDPDINLRFGEAYYRNDSLIIVIYELNAAELMRLEMVIHKQKNSAEFSYATAALGIASMNLKYANLVINLNQFKKGDILKGKINFKSTCTKHCGRKSLEGNGYFKCIIQ